MPFLREGFACGFADVTMVEELGMAAAGDLPFPPPGGTAALIAFLALIAFPALPALSDLSWLIARFGPPTRVALSGLLE